LKAAGKRPAFRLPRQAFQYTCNGSTPPAGQKTGIKITG
jgi:hypothetical protein